MKTSGVIAIFVSMLLILAACGSVSPSLENNEYALPENNEYPLPEDDEYPLLEAYNPLIFEGLWFMVTAGVERTSYEFHQNGEGMMSRIVTLGMHDTPLTWSVSGERLEIFFDDQPTPRIYYFEFLDDDTFTLRREGWSPYSIVTFERVEVIEDNNPLVFEGRWLLAATAGTEGMVYKFHQNGEGTTSRNVVAGAHETPITWSVSGDRLEIFFDDQPTPTEYYFEFLDDDAFTLRRPGWSPYSF
ncbi:MAG: hypothetical protein FWC76_07130, partial [Defluviitaleaceae bacterium]|nr:hypothetical protein [Defluviitaleaceae bacterium]